MDTNQIIVIMTISIMSFNSILLYAAELETKFHLFVDCLCVCILIANYKCVLLNGYSVSLDVFRFVWGRGWVTGPSFLQVIFLQVFYSIFTGYISYIYNLTGYSSG